MECHKQQGGIMKHIQTLSRRRPQPGQLEFAGEIVTLLRGIFKLLARINDLFGFNIAEKTGGLSAGENS
jgi:hypothetical protein